MTDGGPLIVGIGGSTSASSVTSLLLQACLEATAALGARTVAFTGEQLAGLPIFAANGDAAVPAADSLVAAVRAAEHFDHTTAEAVLGDLTRSTTERSVIMVSHRPDGLAGFDRVIDLSRS